jgi:hypothetical protein
MKERESTMRILTAFLAGEPVEITDENEQDRFIDAFHKGKHEGSHLFFVESGRVKTVLRMEQVTHYILSEHSDSSEAEAAVPEFNYLTGKGTR